MTEKELFELIIHYGYGDPGERQKINFTESGKLMPNTEYNFYLNLPDELYNFCGISTPYIELSKRFTDETLITVKYMIINDDTLADDPDNTYTTFLLEKEFSCIPISKVNKDKLINILEVIKRNIKDIKFRYKKYKIKEGF